MPLRNVLPPTSLLLRAIAVPLLVSLAAGLWCWWAAGAALGLFLGATLLTALYVPGLVLAEDGWGRWLVAASAAAGMAIIWAMATFATDVSQWEWLRCTIVLAAFIWAVAGMSSLLAAAHIPKPIAAGGTVLVALLWLTWPVWLSHALTQERVNWLVPADPVLAINAVLQHLGVWDRAPLAYSRLTVLNQDVAYRLPRSIWPALLVHLLIGTPGMISSVARAAPYGRRTRCTAAPDRPQ